MVKGIKMRIKLIVSPVVDGEKKLVDDRGLHPARKGEQFIRLKCLSGEQRRNTPQRQAKRALANPCSYCNNCNVCINSDTCIVSVEDKYGGSKRPPRFAWNTATMVHADLERRSRKEVGE